jgi:hypothetical protein
MLLLPLLLRCTLYFLCSPFRDCSFSLEPILIICSCFVAGPSHKHPLRIAPLAFSLARSPVSYFLPLGIVGLAFQNLAVDGLVTVFQALVQQQNIANVFSMEMCLPSDSWILRGFPTGYLTLGWAPPEAAHPRLYTPLLHEEYYGVEVSGMAVDGVRLDLSCGDYNAPALSIVDSGTTDMLLPEKVFGVVVAAISAQPGLQGIADLQKYFSSGNDREMVPTNLYAEPTHL